MVGGNFFLPKPASHAARANQALRKCATICAAAAREMNQAKIGFVRIGPACLIADGAHSHG
jgi:hypothetical protein